MHAFWSWFQRCCIFDTLEKDEVAEKIFTLKSKQKYTLEEIDEAYDYIEQLKEKAKLN